MLTPYVIRDMDIRATSAEEQSAPTHGIMLTDQAKETWSFSEVRTFPTHWQQSKAGETRAHTARDPALDLWLPRRHPSYIRTKRAGKN